MPTAQTESGSSRLRREDWLKHALEGLRREGVSGLRVEPLARSLGVTTGSFYWHFKDRQDLLDSLLDHWTEQMTRAVARRMTSDEDPADQLRELVEEVAIEEWSRYEIAVRNWATFDTHARRSVRKVDECRLGYVTGLFLQLGFEESEAEIRSRTLLFCHLGETAFSMKESSDSRLETARRQLEILTSDCS